MAKKSKKLSIASLLVMLFAILAIVAFFIPSMTLAKDVSVSGLDMTMEMFNNKNIVENALDVITNPEQGSRTAWSAFLLLKDEYKVAGEAMEVFAFLSIISAGVMLVLGLLGVISKKRSNLLRLLTTIFSLLTLLLGVGGLACGIALQTISAESLLGVTAIALSAGTILTAVAGLLGTLSNLIFKK